MFTLSNDVYGLILLLIIPLLWSFHTSISRPLSKSDPIEVASEVEEEPHEEAEEDHLDDSDSDLTTITANTYNNDKILLPRTRNLNLQYSEVLVIFEQFN
jgi:hypothetical protein